MKANGVAGLRIVDSKGEWVRRTRYADYDLRKERENECGHDMKLMVLKSCTHVPCS